MAKGIIKANLGKGLYNVDIDRDMTVVNAKIDRLQQKITQLYDDLTNLYPPKIQAIQDKITELNDQLEFANDQEANQIIKALIPLRLELQRVTDQKTLASIDKENYAAQYSKLITLKGITNQDLWCVDYTTDLEIGAEVGITNFKYHRETALADPVILPNQSKVGDRTGKSQYWSLRDGALVPQQGLSVNAWWYAMSSYTAIAQHLPRYRKGTLIAINSVTNTGTVAVDGYDALNNVPIRYLGCDSAAFIVNDRVVIQYPIKDVHEKLSKRYDAIRKAIMALATSMDTLLVQIAAELTHIKTDLTTKSDRLLDITFALSGTEISDQFRSDLNTELRYLKMEINYLNGQHTVLSNRKSSLDIQKISIADQSTRVTPLVASEMGKSKALQPLIKQFPDVPTVIGFVSHPKPCGLVIGFVSAPSNPPDPASSDPRWKRITADGIESNASYDPTIYNNFNRGMPNEDGQYDCACVWSGDVLRHNGIHYSTGHVIESAGIRSYLENNKKHYSATIIYKADSGDTIPDSHFYMHFVASFGLSGVSGSVDLGDPKPVFKEPLEFVAIDAKAEILVVVTFSLSNIYIAEISKIIDDVPLVQIDQKLNYFFNIDGYGSHQFFKKFYTYQIKGARNWGIDKEGRVAILAYIMKDDFKCQLSIYAIDNGQLIKTKDIIPDLVPGDGILFRILRYIIPYGSATKEWDWLPIGGAYPLLPGVIGFDAYTSTVATCTVGQTVGSSTQWWVNDKIVLSVSQKLDGTLGPPLDPQDMDAFYNGYLGIPYTNEFFSEMVGSGDYCAGCIWLYKNNYLLIRGANGEKSKIVSVKSSNYTLLI